MRYEEPKSTYSLLLLLSVSAVIAYTYFRQIIQPNLAPMLELHGQILQGIAPSPYRYRILVPYLTEIIKRVFSLFVDSGHAFLFAYVLYDFFSIFLLLVSLFKWLRVWFSSEQALVGVLFVAGTMPIALRDHYFQPWSFLEPVFFTLAFYAMFRKRYLFLASIVLVASLNRETALFIPLTFLLLNFQELVLSQALLDVCSAFWHTGAPSNFSTERSPFR